MKNLYNQFLLQLKSKNTTTAYRSDLEKFLNYFPNIKLSEITTETIGLYNFNLIAEAEAPSTYNRRFASLKAFFNWCVENNYMQKNPTQSIKLKKAPVIRPTLACSDKEALMLINAPKIDTFHGCVHRITMILLFNLGLRRSELVNLKFSDIHNEQGCTFVRFMAKGGKVREIPLSNSVLEEIENYKNRYKDLCKKELVNEDYIIQSESSEKNTKPISTTSIYRIVVNLRKQCGLKDRLSPHSCRATVLSQLLENGTSPRDVADFAGHSNINTTMIYDKKRKKFENSAAFKVSF